MSVHLPVLSSAQSMQPTIDPALARMADWPRMSASQLDTFSMCPRKWGWQYLDNIKSPPHRSAAAGTRVHKILEDWLREGRPPNPGEVLVLDGRPYEVGLIAISGLHNLPPPGPHHDIEVAIQAPFLTGYPATWRGFIDSSYSVLNEGATTGPVIFTMPDGSQVLGAVTYTPEVLDHKTTSNLGYRKTPEDLKTDVQALVYAHSAMLRTGARSVNLRWVYYKTVKPYKSEVSFTTLTAEHVARELAVWEQLAIEGPLKAKSLKLRAMQMRPNPRACNRFGGCPHKGVRCALTSREVMVASMAGEMDLLAKIAAAQQDLSGGAPAPLPPQQGGMMPVFGQQMPMPLHPFGQPESPQQMQPQAHPFGQWQQPAAPAAQPPGPQQPQQPQQVPVMQAMREAVDGMIRAGWSDQQIAQQVPGSEPLIAAARALLQPPQVQQFQQPQPPVPPQVQGWVPQPPAQPQMQPQPQPQPQMQPQIDPALRASLVGAITNGAQDSQILAYYPGTEGVLAVLRQEMTRPAQINAPESTGLPQYPNPAALPPPPAGGAQQGSAPAPKAIPAGGDEFDAMTRNELKALAEKHGIDVKGLREKNLRLEVRKHLKPGAVVDTETSPGAPAQPAPQPQVMMQQSQGQQPQVMMQPQVLPYPTQPEAMQMPPIPQQPEQPQVTNPAMVQTIRQTLDYLNAVGDNLRKLIGAD